MSPASSPGAAASLFLILAEDSARCQALLLVSCAGNAMPTFLEHDAAGARAIKGYYSPTANIYRHSRRAAHADSPRSASPRLSAPNTPSHFSYFDE